MAEAWLTYVTRDDQVSWALVLAESLRRTGTTRRIGVITCTSVSSQEKHSLSQAFDRVFSFGEDVSDINGKTDFIENGIRAKIFAFSLELFEKCVFLEPNSILLENADWLFEGKGGIVPLANYDGKSHVLEKSDYFLFRPCFQFSEYLAYVSRRQNGWRTNGVTKVLVDHAKKWTENNLPVYKQTEEGDKWKNAVMQLSLKNGDLLQKECWNSPSIIQFVDGPINDDNYKKILQVLMESSAVGLTEKAIIRMWIKLSEETKCSTVVEKSNLHYANEPIAIVGVSCRLPGANNLEEFWNLLYSGKESIRQPPAFRWKKEHSVMPCGKKEKSTCAGFLSTTVDEFDAKFFGVSPKEAVFLDPQSRLLHEVMWESLENAGIDPLSLYGSHTGIFTGSWMNDYKDIIQWSSSRDFFRTYMGNSIGATSARLSFLLGLTGPNIATESGCSSAMVAVDMAVKSLRHGETNLAMAGGVNLVLHPFSSNIMEFVIAPDGRCKTFDAKADGFGRAEACGFLVLKRLSDALLDKDHIWAMIRGSAVSQEGISRSLGTPTVHCEALAMELAMENAGVRPEQITFVETHGTGTAVGDPMEVAAIAKAYRSRHRDSPLVIGSVKTNVGHTESVSGITGIIKTVLAMKHELIPKHLNLDTLNPDINLDIIPAVIPLEPIPWPKVPGQPRYAGVSSFGITGTDGHVILQEAPDNQFEKFTIGIERPLHILKISTKSKEALDNILANYETYLTGDNIQSKKSTTSHKKSDEKSSPEEDSRIDDIVYKENVPSEKELKEKFADIAFTANIGRASFEHRAYILASNTQDAAEVIKQNKFVRSEAGEAGRKLCFLFTGQGSQYQGMARSLYETSPVFQFHFDYCAKILLETYKVSLREILWESEPESKELSRTIYSQTSIFCVEYCLLKLWESWGLHPDYVLGHSLGEFCAAVAAGVLTFKDALKLVAVRSGLINKLPRGSMLVLKADQKQVEEAMKSANIQLEFAAINSPEQTVVAGDTLKISDFLSICKGKEMKGIILEATHAFHSSHMDPMLNEYRKAAESIRYNQPTTVQYISGMEGKVREELDADYWVSHTREKVNFLEACKTMRGLDCANFLEVGPQPVLSTFVLQNIEDRQISCYPSLRRKVDDWETILTSLGKIWIDGFRVDWQGFDKPYSRRKVATLPFYPFNRKSHWVECNETLTAVIHPLIGSLFSNASSLNIFENNLSVNAAPYLKDHCIGTRIVFPGAGFIEMCLSAGYCVANFIKENFDKPTGPIALENISIDQPLELKDGKFCKMQVLVDLPEIEEKPNFFQQDEEQTEENINKPHGFRCKVFHKNQTDIEESSSSGKWVPHATAMFHPVLKRSSDLLQSWNGDRVKELIGSKEPMKMDGFYKRIDAIGLKFGDTFRSIQRQWIVQQDDMGELDEVVAEMKIPQDFDKYLLHPLIIDAMFQAQILAGIRSQKSDALRVPVRIGKLILFNCLEEIEGSTVKLNEDDMKIQPVLYIHAKWTAKDNCTLFVCTEDFAPVAMMEDVELLETNVKTIMSVLEQQNSKTPDCWEEIWKPIIGPCSNRIQLVNMEELFTAPGFQDKIKAANTMVPEDKDHYQMMNRLVALYTLRGLDQLGWRPRVGEEFKASEFCEKYKIKPQLKQLVYFYFKMFQDEMHNFVDRLGEDAVGQEQTWKINSIPFDSEELITREIDELYLQLSTAKRAFVLVKIYENVAKYLPKVLKGEENILTILFPTDPKQQELSAETYYKRHPGLEDMASKNLVGIRALLSTVNKDDLDEKKTIVRVLEVGAGTGSYSIYVLKELRSTFGSNFEYYYTDISAGFFSKADKLLEEYRNNIKYITFNLEENPLAQGIPVNYFDFVFATEVLHATRNLKECAINLRMTMVPNAIINFTDTVIQDKGITFVFGCFEGYWRFEDFDKRPHHTCVSVDTWEEVLAESGFIYTYSCVAYFGLFGSMFGHASQLPGYVEGANQMIRSLPEGEKRKKWIIFAPENDLELMAKIKSALIIGGNNVVIVTPTPGLETEEDEKTTKIYNLLATGEDEELRGIIYAWGMVEGVQEQRKFAIPFLHIAKYMINVNKPPRLYVFTKNVHSIMDEENDPFAATLHGMAKSLKNENSHFFVRCVDLDGRIDVNTITDQILYDLAMFKDTKEKERVEVAYRNIQRYEPRFSKVVIQQQSRSDLKLPPSTDRYQLVLPESKMINDLEFAPLDDEPLGEKDIMVLTKTYSLNFRDILTIIKPTEEFESLNSIGLDYAGIVCRVGEGVDPEKAKVGDKVFGINTKVIRLPSHLVTDEDAVLKMPPRMTFCEASTLPAVLATSIYCLYDVAKLKEGETVLIHTGSGGVGLSAIQVARYLKAKIITTAGSPRKRAYLKSLGLEHIFHSRNTSYKEEILKVTNGRGVDVVLNSITGPSFKEATLETCAEGGRFVEMSKLSIWKEEEVKALRPDVHYSIVDLTELKREKWLEVKKKTDDLIERGEMTTIPYVKFDVLRLRQALQFFQKAKHIGKVVVTMPEVKIEHGQWKVKLPLFNDNSTYMITGGLGGIGFEVCKWMLEMGATDIVLVGRTPPKPEMVKEIERLNLKNGNNVMVRLCDVGNYDQMKKLVDELAGSGFKPLRGIQHCAGVLWDNLYANQTWESFEATFNAKVQGTWNLHQLTKHIHLEHFVLYSSITALVGTPGQANHASANCFEDAFTHYRYSLGLPATAINWGQWSQVGVAKEINVSAVLPVSVVRMLNGLEEVMRSQRVQTAFGEFESLSLWAVVCPSLKYYLDERLMNSVNDSKGDNQANLLQSAKFWQEIDEAETTDAKMAVVINYMKIVLRNALRMDPDDPIKDDANMQDLGVDSLMLIELKNSIQGLLGSRLNVTSIMLKDCRTIRQLATVIVNKIEDNEQEDLANTPNLSPEELTELFNEDFQLDESIRPDSNQTEMKASDMKIVLVTGATGQLGPHIVSQLCRISTLEKIVCLVRARESVSPMERLKEILKSVKLENDVDMNKIDCVRGNVAQENLGLDQDNYERLCESVDGVIHLAAKTNDAEPYRKVKSNNLTDVRSVNVGGTREILKFAVTQKTKRVYFASAFSSIVSGGDSYKRMPDSWPESRQDQAQVLAESGYTGQMVSKVVSEMLLKEARQRGVPCKVFRFPWIMGDSKTGQLNFHSNKYILRFLTYLKLKVMPSYVLPAQVLPVDICANWSLKVFWNDNAPNEIYNIVHPDPQLETEFVKVAKEEFDTDVEIVDWSNEEFLEKLYASDIPTEVLKEMYQDIDKILGQFKIKLHFLKGWIDSHETFFQNPKLRKYSPGFQDGLPTTMDIIKKDLTFVKDAGYFKKFGV